MARSFVLGMAHKMTDQLQGVAPQERPAESSPGPDSLFQHRNFMLFLSGQTLSKLGNGVYTVGLAWTVYSLTGSTIAMGAVMAVNALPELALALFGGAINDRAPRRLVIIACDSVAAVVLAALT